MKLGDRLLGLLFVVLGLAMLRAAGSFPSAPGTRFGAGLFPSILGGGFAASGIVLIVQDLVASDRGPLFVRPAWAADAGTVLRFLLVPAAVLFYILASPTIGMVVASVMILGAFFAVLRVRARVAIAVAVSMSLAIHLAFSRMLQVPLPRGWLSGVLP